MHGREAGRIETWLTCPILIFMAAAFAIATIFPAWPKWIRALPLGLAGLLILVALRYALTPPRPPDRKP
jgi:hypothetical protein